MEQKIIKGKKYTFHRETNEKYEGGSHLLSLYEGFSNTSHGLFVGQVMTLFGQDITTDDYENALSCIVAADAPNEDTIYLEVYYGPSGPAIGGGNSEADTDAACELKEIIMNVVPIDCSCESIYEDLGVRIIMGTKNGIGFYDTVIEDEDFKLEMEQMMRDASV